ncbi:MAG: cation-translocating P-type ATPase [Fusobacteriaceae bacterium]
MYYKKTKEEILEIFNSSLDGIKEKDLLHAIDKYGLNELKEKEKIPTWKLFLDSFRDSLVIILLIAAGIQIVSGHFIDSFIILVVLILNSILGVVQRIKADNSLSALKKLSDPNAKVIRDKNKLTISLKSLVPGDLVILETGDYVPADGRILESESLKVVEGILTGESEPISKISDTIHHNSSIGERKNMVFSGTMVVYGRGIFIVTATGMHTEIGKIATLMEETDQTTTPLQKNIEAFTKKIGISILFLSIIIFIILLGKAFLIEKNNNLYSIIISAFMFSVAVAVAAIPEALSSVVTIVLSVGTNLMAKNNAIIRKLPAVETLGSTSVICTDKTGTLTQNKMTVVDYFMYGINEANLEEKKDWNYSENYQKYLFLMSATLVNDSFIGKNEKEIGDPTELALLNFAIKHNINIENTRNNFKRIGELPFDSNRKLMSSVHKIKDEVFMFVKGAPDIILNRCKYALKEGKKEIISNSVLEDYKNKNEEFSNNALRVLALAYKKIKKENFVLTLEDENDLILIGLVAMIDPPREEVFSAIAEAKSAGIKVVMITGDHKTTAAAIAVNIGLMNKGDISITGHELDLLSETELNNKLEKISVYARVSPENKIRIVKAWQNKNKITAMTGDGVNDAPALKQADIGIAMGSGTDVAKDASSLILTDDNFATIIHAISIGRTVYNNIKNSITYLFIGNLGAIATILFSLLAGWAVPFSPLQLLFINLINDSIPAIALGLESQEKNIMLHKPRVSNEPLFSTKNYAIIITRGIFISIVTVIAQFIGGPHETLGMSMAFSTLIFSRILQTLPARSYSTTIFQLGLFSNKYVIVAIIACFSLYSVSLLSFTRKYFSITDNFGLYQFGICLALAFASTLFMELDKIIRKKFNKGVL